MVGEQSPERVELVVADAFGDEVHRARRDHGQPDGAVDEGVLERRPRRGRRTITTTARSTASLGLAMGQARGWNRCSDLPRPFVPRLDVHPRSYGGLGENRARLVNAHKDAREDRLQFVAGSAQVVAGQCSLFNRIFGPLLEEPMAWLRRPDVGGCA